MPPSPLSERLILQALKWAPFWNSSYKISEPEIEHLTNCNTTKIDGLGHDEELTIFFALAETMSPRVSSRGDLIIDAANLFFWFSSAGRFFFWLVGLRVYGQLR